MKIRYFSDLHLEFVKTSKLDTLIRKIPPGEICVLAGDIGNPFKINYDVFMNAMSKTFVKTFVIPGNHEYYGKTIEETNDYMKDYFKWFDNITLLNNSYEIYDNRCFIGTTLWSNISDERYKINDMSCIHGFDISQYNKLNKECVSFLEDTLENMKEKKSCIVISHHMPSESLIDPKYKTERMAHYNQWFYCNMDNLIESNQEKIQCWFYGHTHTPLTSILHGVPMLCNPIGYPGENTHSDYQKEYEIKD